MKFEGIVPGAIFIERAQLDPISHGPPRLRLHIVVSKPSAVNDSFSCRTLDVREPEWTQTYWKPNMWRAAGGGKVASNDRHDITKAIFSATHK